MKNAFSLLTLKWARPRLARRLAALAVLTLAPAGAALAQTLQLLGTGSPTNASYDVTTFVDKVELVRVSDGSVVPGALANAGFENIATLAPWSPVSASLADNNSPYSPPTPFPEGSQVALIQGAGSSLSQALTLVPGTYQVRFFAAQRACCSGVYDQAIVVKVGGVQVGVITPPTGRFVSYTGAVFTVSSTGTVSTATTFFAYTGGTQSYVVPAGVTSISVLALGGAGGRYTDSNYVSNFSYGAQVQATLAVTPGEVLTVVVGGQGGSTDNAPTAPGGYNGGGSSYYVGGGGGATDLRRTGASTGDYLTSRNALLVAGGAGGSDVSGNTGAGGNGGTPTGGNGANFAGSNVGMGATQTGPGSGFNAGSNNQGGSATTEGGGGGGGYYGGGAAGGGGSSWVRPTGSSGISYSVAAANGNGVLSITPVPDLVVSTPGQTIAPGTYNSITVQSGGTGTLQGNVTVNTSTTINSGGTLNDGCNILSGAGTFTLAAGGTLGICSAQGIAGSGATGAVQVSGTRSFSSDASYVYNGTGAQSTGPGLPPQVRNLTTTNANPVTLSQAVSVAQALTVAAAGNLATGGNALTLPSTATGTALVVNSGTGSVVGSVTMQRYTDPSLNPNMGYRHYSAPVGNTTLADLATTSYSPEISQASVYNASATPGTTTPFPTLFAYDQSRLATVTSNYSAFDKGFVVPTTLSTAMSVGRGYVAQIGAAALVDFVGTPTTGDQATLNLSRNGFNTPNFLSAGWQLVGNPYPSPLDWSLVAPADRANLDAAMYVVQSTGPYAGGYRTYVNGQSTTATNNPLIASSQGFWVRVSTGQTSGTLTFRNAQRVTSYASQQAFQRTTADPRPALRLTLAGAGLADTWVAYAETGATPAFDGQYDAGKLPNSTGLNLSSVTVAEYLAIDGQAAFTPTTVLPLAVGVPAAGTYTLSTTALDNLPAGLTATLRDTQTGQTVPLATGSRYSFSVTAAQAQALVQGRFTVQFGAAAPLASASAQLAGQVSVYPNPAQASFAVLVPGVATASAVQAELLNPLGQRVRQQSAALPAAGAHLTFDTAGLAAGVYVLRLTAGPATATQRVVVQ